MSTAISIRNLRKSFGKTQAVNDLSLEIESGDIYGLLGPNGAGKTTTMKIISTLLRPDWGTVHVLGKDVVSQAADVRPRIGYMPDSSFAYRDMLVSEYLEFFAAAYRVPSERRLQVVNDCIELTGLQEKRDELIEGLSRGMQQRLGLARCLIHNPEVLILDEPASGLDPRARIEILEVLRQLGTMGKTVLISSHILSELRTLCNKICIIERGKLIFGGTIDQALKLARTEHRLEIKVHDRPEAACDFLAKLDGIRSVQFENEHIVAVLPDDVSNHSFVAEALVKNGFGLLMLKEEEVLLEDAFIKLTDTAMEAENAGLPPAMPR
jgi:ABC-2 type transport system ATP-binding protein